MIDEQGVDRRRRARRAALLLGAVALAFYVTFILMSVMRTGP
ncbi:MAG: hypothetical protein WCE48_12450 [Steroidobacteraceae bacterium]